MSLTTLLSGLQTLITSRFLVTSILPMTAFWFAHSVMLFFLNARFREYVLENFGQTAGLTAIATTASTVGIIMSAYALSALLPTIQSLMEGNWGRFGYFFVPSQMNRYEWIESRVRENLRLRGGLQARSGELTRVEAWKKSLTDARVAGNRSASNSYKKGNASALKIAQLARLRKRGQPINGDQLNRAVSALVPDLGTNNADEPGPDMDFALEDTRDLLWKLIDYADGYASNQYRSLITRRTFNYGPLPLAPTQMGNVARSVQGYCVERYNFNFEPLWSRLQLYAQRDKDFGPLLQDTKTQLDFLISSSALTLLWAIPWGVWLAASSGPAWLFVSVALGGPLVAYLWYWAAMKQYRTLADLLRSAVDIFRFDLLVALHFALPGSVQQERTLWDQVDALHTLNEIYDLPYAPSKP